MCTTKEVFEYQQYNGIFMEGSTSLQTYRHVTMIMNHANYTLGKAALIPSQNGINTLFTKSKALNVPKFPMEMLQICKLNAKKNE